MSKDKPAKGNSADIPSATISRLVKYMRKLEYLESQEINEISSEELAGLVQGSAFQVRKDLAYFGTFGTRGAGYTVPTLLRELRSIFGLTKQWNVVIVGMGRLGQALADYPRFKKYKYKLKCAVDIDSSVISKVYSGLIVKDIRELAQIIQEKDIEIGFLTVPQDAAQKAADTMIKAGIKGILNFTPAVIRVSGDVHIETVDFLAGLKRITYYIK